MSQGFKRIEEFFLRPYMIRTIKTLITLLISR